MTNDKIESPIENGAAIAKLQQELDEAKEKTDFYQERFFRLLEKETHLVVLNSLSQALMGKVLEQEIFDAIPGNTFSLLGFPDCVIFLHDEENKRLVQKGVFIENREIVEDFFVPIDEGVVGAVFKSGVGEIVKDCSLDARYIPYFKSKGSEVTAPIMSDGKVIGIIDAEHPEKNSFNLNHLEFLKSIARIIAPMIQNAKTQQKLLNYKEQLEKIVEEQSVDLAGAIDNVAYSNKEITRQRNEKDVLLREIHHRVKNNMQIINSLLNLQMNKSGDPTVLKHFEECQNRIISMSLIHSQLYESNDLSSINIGKYIRALIKQLIRTYNISKEIKLKMDLVSIQFDLNTLIPLGLVINEMISNSMKYAFPEQDDCLITISLERNKGIYSFDYKDNGIGFDLEEVKARTDQSLGFELIYSLMDQIDGRIQKEDSEKGVHFKLFFAWLNEA